MRTAVARFVQFLVQLTDPQTGLTDRPIRGRFILLLIAWLVLYLHPWLWPRQEAKLSLA